jgi:hypothetical protein
MKLLLITAGVVVMAVAGLPSVRPSTHGNNHCQLAASFVLLGSPNRVAVRNSGNATWTDARLTIDGQIISGPNAGRPSGIHTLERSIEPGLTVFQLSEFQNGAGTRWAAQTMRVDGIDIAATVRGERCELEHTFGH